MLRRCRSLFTSLLLLLLTGLVPLSVSAQVPHDMAYQGVLTDAVGAPLTGPVTLVFRVFDMPSGGTPLYTETHSDVAIDPIDGSFLVQLGLGTTDLDTDGDGDPETNLHAFDASLFENGPNRYLEIQVGSGVSGEILDPRQMIGSVPYALVAEDVVTDPATSSVGALIEAAQSTADTAVSNAATAQGAADAAQGTANTAVSTAATAQDAANAAQGTANTAVSTADTAVINAATAQGAADAAQGTANTAVSTAGTAVINAATAQDAADAAQGTANTAVSDAATAQGIADANTAVRNSYGPFARPGSNNTAVGQSALALINSGGENNTGIGAAALFSNTTGDHNTAIGRNALRKNQGGLRNTATGVDALRDNLSGNHNVSSGFNSMFRNTSGSNNTASGQSALLNNTTGSNNIALGISAGAALTTGDNNIMIGNGGVAGESGIIRLGTTGTHIETHLVGDVFFDGVAFDPAIDISGIATNATAIATNVTDIATAQSTADTAVSNAATAQAAANAAQGTANTAASDAATAQDAAAAAQVFAFSAVSTAETAVSDAAAAQSTAAAVLSTVDAVQGTAELAAQELSIQADQIAALQAQIGELQAVVGGARFVPCTDGLTVADSETGLLWERKTGTVGSSVTCETAPGGCPNRHDVNNLYEWSNTGTAADGNAYTDFLFNLNAGSGFAGHTDWRLPVISELQSLLVGPAVTLTSTNVDPPDPAMGTNPTGQSEACGAGPCIDPRFAAIGGPTASSLHWSAATFTPNPIFAWVVNFGTDLLFNDNKSRDFFVRAVRGGSCGS